MIENLVDVKAMTMESMPITCNPSKLKNLESRGECTWYRCQIC